MQNSIFDTWHNNYQANKARLKQKLDSNYFLNKNIFSLFVFKADFVLKIKCNLCFFVLSWLEINHKTRHCQGDDSCNFIYKMYKEKFIKIVNLPMGKNESTR